MLTRDGHGCAEWPVRLIERRRDRPVGGPPGAVRAAGLDSDPAGLSAVRRAIQTGRRGVRLAPWRKWDSLVNGGALLTPWRRVSFDPPSSGLVTLCCRWAPSRGRGL